MNIQIDREEVEQSIEIVVVQKIESQTESQPKTKSDIGNLRSKAVPTLGYVVFETILTIVLVYITLNSEVSNVFIDIEIQTIAEYYYEKYGYDYKYDNGDAIIYFDYTIQIFFWIILSVTLLSYFGVQTLQNLGCQRILGFIFMLSYVVLMCGIASVSQAVKLDETTITNGIIIVVVCLAWHISLEWFKPLDTYLITLWLPIATGIVTGFILNLDFLCYEVIMYGCIHSVHTFYHVKAIRFVEVECSFLESLKIFGILAQLSREILLYAIYQPYHYVKSLETRVIVYLNKADAKQKVQYLVITYSIMVISIWYFLWQWYLGYATSKYSDYIEIYVADDYFMNSRVEDGFEYSLTSFGEACLIVPSVLHFIVMLLALDSTNLCLKILSIVLGFVEIIFIGYFTGVIASIQVVTFYFVEEQYYYSTEYFLGFCMIIFLSLISHILSGKSIDNIKQLLLFWFTIPLLFILLWCHTKNYYSISSSTMIALPYTYYVYLQSYYILNSSGTGIAINDYLIGALSLMNPPAQIIVNLCQIIRQRQKKQQTAPC